MIGRKIMMTAAVAAALSLSIVAPAFSHHRNAAHASGDRGGGSIAGPQGGGQAFAGGMLEQGAYMPDGFGYAAYGAPVFGYVAWPSAPAPDWGW